MLTKMGPGLFESELTGTRLEEMSVEYDQDLEIRWLVDHRTGSIGLFLARPASSARLAPVAPSTIGRQVA